MARLVSAEDVKERLMDVQGLQPDQRPERLTDPIIDGYTEQATGTVLAAIRRSTIPASGTDLRKTLNGYCLDLVVIAIKRDIFGLDAGVASALNSQERLVLEKLANLADSLGTGGGSIFFEVVDTA